MSLFARPKKRTDSEFKHNIRYHRDHDDINEEYILGDIVDGEFNLNEAVDYIIDVHHQSGWVTYSFKDEKISQKVDGVFRERKRIKRSFNDIEKNLHKYITNSLYPIYAEIECISDSDMKNKIAIISKTLVDMKYDPYTVMNVSGVKIIIKLRDESDRMKFLLLVK